MNIRHLARQAKREFERLAFLIEFQYHKEDIMAALTDLQATVATLATTASAVEAEVQTLQSTDDEAALAALNTSLQGINTQLAGLLPAPVPPAS